MFEKGCYNILIFLSVVVSQSVKASCVYKSYVADVTYQCFVRSLSLNSGTSQVSNLENISLW